MKTMTKETENEKMDQILSWELMEKAAELEKEAMKEPVEIPKEDAQAMLDRMLDAIHSDPEWNAIAQRQVKDRAPVKSETAFDAEMAEDEDLDEIIRLGRAVKASGKSLEDILETESLPAPEADKSKKKRRRWSRPAKIFTGVAAAFVVLVSVSMSSSAMKAFWIEKFELLFGNKPRTVLDNDVHFSEDEEYSEIEALNIIKESIGISPIYFREMPENMTYQYVYVDEEGEWAKIFYEYEEKIVTIFMEKSNEEMSLGKVYDGEDLGGIETEVQGQKVVVHKIQRDAINTAFYMELEYGGVFYSVIGDMVEDVFMGLIAQMAFW